MAQKKVKQDNMTYAIRDGILVNISDVDSGLKCECVCPACGTQLIARKGKLKSHHFAHYNVEECEHGYETSLHLAAKQIILDNKVFSIPAVFLEFPNSNREKALIAESKEIVVDEVKLETRMNNIVPDILVYTNGKMLQIEIFVTHKIDEEKLNKIKSNGISVIEIDLSKVENSEKEELKELLLGNSEKKSWKYNVVAEKYAQMFKAAANFMPIVHRGFANHIDLCPIAMRTWNSKPYANFMDDCIYCEFCIEAGVYRNEREGILCSGKSKIARTIDFSISKDERNAYYKKKYEKQKYEAMAEGRCPNCGSKLKEREGKFGKFWGCSNYPYCRFTLNVD
ncbi:MAG: competence protein CoiA family protein, partial [Anaerovorax sp.]|nr:competence protein CoiA family protein [Anaerovorax sp.]